MLLVAPAYTTMFAEADALTEQVSQALLGQPVMVLESVDEWRKVRTPDDYSGWVRAEALAEAPEGWDGPWVEVTDLWANLRARPSFMQAPVAHAPIGTRLPLVGEEEPFVQVLLPDGRRPWTEAKRVARLGTTPLRPAEPHAIIQTALRLRGVPYLWGGCTPLGLDCSGFVQLVMRLHGVQIERDAGPQARQGVDSPGPDAADLVFFSPQGPNGSITHVGMMLDGDRFIHALGSDYVRLNRLSEERYQKMLHSIRRYV